MSKIEVNTVEPQCGTTLTLGGSGDTVTLGSGASQSGFGRQGSVNWQTSIKTATFTAASGEGYFCNTSGGAFTVNLPSSPSVGDIVAIKDYASSFDTQNLTIGRGGSNMNGSAADSVRDTENESLTLVYADATKGWLAVEEGTGYVGEVFLTASGGTITTCGDFKIHTFTGPGNFCVSALAGCSSNNSLEYIVVAGGGGGGRNYGAGAGAGGFRFASPSLAPLTYPGKPLAAPASITATVQSYPITIGAGGNGATPGGSGADGTNGSNSSFSSITSTGGGRGGSNASPTPSYYPGQPGGSGGGAKNCTASAGSGNTPPVSPAQGTNGGAGGNPCRGGGGGGAIVAGTAGSGSGSGPGGDGAGIPTAFGSNGVPCGSFRYYAGGGGGGGNGSTTTTGGKGGGGNGGVNQTGTANTGGGGGGAGDPGGSSGSNGGSGIVIIRYKYQ